MTLFPGFSEEDQLDMPTAPERLFVYQINTWVWLNTMSRRYGEPITLHNVPDVELEMIARPGIDMVWLMGIWQRSPAGLNNALKYKHEYRAALPDLRDDDVIGSAYALYDYEVDERIGGREGLAALRKRLRRRGLTLMLDFVPNHVAFDHPWLETHPEYFIAGTPEDAARRPSDFYAYTTSTGEKRIYANGRDPLWPGWSDTAQLNSFSPALRKAMLRTLLDIAKQCDSVRCDMAMLFINSIFADTWRGFVDQAPSKEYWQEMIGGVKKVYPEFLFVAEAYWGKEYELIKLGFDFAYDKVLYDRILEGDVQKLRQHLLADVRYQQHMIRFIENHDEKRAYETLGPRRSVPAATLICTLPGAVLLHDGQLVGRRAKLPVQIKRQPDEIERRDLEGLYNRLLKEIRSPIYTHGTWTLFDIQPLDPGDITHWNLLAYGWVEPNDGDFRLIVVNMTQHGSHGRVDLSAWPWLDGRNWRLYDVIDGAEYQRHGGTMTSEGLTIILEPFEAHVFRFEQVREVARPRLNGAEHGANGSAASSNGTSQKARAKKTEPK